MFMVSVTWRSSPQKKGWVQTLSSHFVLFRINMSMDHLCKEGPAEVEDIEIPSNIIFIFTIYWSPFMELTIKHIFIFLDSLLVFFTGLFNWDLTYMTCYFIGISSSILTAYSHKEYHHWTLLWAETVTINNVLHTNKSSVSMCS